MKVLKKIFVKDKWIAGCILFAAGFMLLCISRYFRGFAQWYSIHVYPLWVNAVGRLMGIFPFSVSEIFLYIILLSIVRKLLKFVLKVFQKQEVKQDFLKWCNSLWVLAGALFFLYAVNCGVNYHRESFAESVGFETNEYSKEELRDVCLWLTEEVNARSSAVSRDENGVMRLQSEEKGKPDRTLQKTNQQAAEAMKHLSREYPQLSGYYPKPKGLIFPWILSVQQLTGIYSPFTIEANYNSAVVDYNIPFTACHELSHLRGFMQEEEANFIAFLASSSAEDIQFQYSGYLMGWKYCMNVLYKEDYKAWEELRASLSPAVEPDLAANREFWDNYDGKIAETANKVNDTYLKANNQSEGVKSYNRMVDLVVAYYIRYVYM